MPLASRGDKKEEKKETAGKRDLSKSKAYRILLKPLVTEKATNLGAESKYVFAVLKKTNKTEVAKAVYDIYKIKPVNVNIINMKGKKVRFGRIQGKRKDWKKAVVTLPKGKTIDVYEGI